MSIGVFIWENLIKSDPESLDFLFLKKLGIQKEFVAMTTSRAGIIKLNYTIQHGQNTVPAHLKF